MGEPAFRLQSGSADPGWRGGAFGQGGEVFPPVSDQRHDLAAHAVDLAAGMLTLEDFVEIPGGAVVAEHPETAGEHRAADAVVGGGFHQRPADAGAAMFLEHVDHADLGFPRGEGLARGTYTDKTD